MVPAAAARDRVGHGAAVPLGRHLLTPPPRRWRPRGPGQRQAPRGSRPPESIGKPWPPASPTNTPSPRCGASKGSLRRQARAPALLPPPCTTRLPPRLLPPRSLPGPHSTAGRAPESPSPGALILTGGGEASKGNGIHQPTTRLSKMEMFLDTHMYNYKTRPFKRKNIYKNSTGHPRSGLFPPILLFGLVPASPPRFRDVFAARDSGIWSPGGILGLVP